MKSKSIIFVSAGLVDAKKVGNPFAQFHSYLNYGLLGLASLLHKKGYNPKVYHGKYLNPESFAEFVIDHSSCDNDYPLFLSLPSVFAIGWAKRFIERFRSFLPKIKVVIGGRWVVENDGNWIRSVLPDIDLVVYGTAEGRIENLLDFKSWDRINYTDRSLFQIPESQIFSYPTYNYKLMYDYLDFNPSIEVSRGCGLGCSFCLEKDAPLQNLKTVDNILQEINNIQATYKDEFITPYFESSFFRPSSQWSKQLAQSYKDGNFGFKWRAETRIDSLSEDILTSLAGSGLKILDIGLESASISQLKLMNKSTKPEVYLERASKFLKICKSLGIWAKVNVLLYAGETINSINETIEWLDIHKDCIKGVSVNPLIVYGKDEGTKLYLEELKNLGAEPVNEEFYLKGYTNMHLSQEVSYEISEEYRIHISKLFMSADDYFDLKSFSYFPKSFQKSQFLDICHNADISKLPFNLQGEKVL